MAYLAADDFYDKWVPLLSDNDFQNINGSRFEQFLEDLRDSFAPVSSVNGTPVPPAVNFDPVNRLLTAYHPLGTGELEYSHNNGGFTPWATIAVDDLGHPQGEWRLRVQAAAGRNASQLSDSPAIKVKAVVTPAGPGTITASLISDATAAGRALLTAKDVAAQRALLDKLNLEAGHFFADQPRFDRFYGDDGALAYLLKKAGGAVAPAAPTNGHVDDTADTFYATINSLYKSLGDYELYYPGSGGTVPATNGRADLVGTTLTVRGLAGPVAVGTVGIRVAASGNRPASAWCTNDEAFTGSIVIVQPAAPNFSGFDDVANTVSVSHATLAVSELVYDFNGATGIAVPLNNVISVGNLAGQVTAYAKAAPGRPEGLRANSQPFTITVTIADPTVALASPQEGQTLTVGDPVVLNATPDGKNSQVQKVEFLDNGVKFTETTVAPHTVQRAITAGAHSFTARVFNMLGASGLSNPVAVTGVAASVPVGQVLNVTSDLYEHNVLDALLGGQPRRSPLAPLRKLTVNGASKVTIKQFTNYTDGPCGGTLSLDGGAPFVVENTAAGGVQAHEYSLPTSGTHTLEWLEGPQYSEADNGTIQNLGALLSITLDNGTISVAAAPARRANVFVLLSDSIPNSAGASSLNKGIVPLLRKLLGDTWEVIVIGYGSKGWKSLRTAASQTELADLVTAAFANRTGRTVFGSEPAINDYWQSYQDIPTTMGYAGQVFDRIYADHPLAEFILQTAIYSPKGTRGNAFGELLADQTSAFKNLAAARNYLRLFDATNAVTPTNIAGDELHPLDAGHVELAEAWLAQLQFSEYTNTLTLNEAGGVDKTYWSVVGTGSRNDLNYTVFGVTTPTTANDGQQFAAKGNINDKGGKAWFGIYTSGGKLVGNTVASASSITPNAPNKWMLTVINGAATFYFQNDPGIPVADYANSQVSNNTPISFGGLPVEFDTLGRNGLVGVCNIGGYLTTGLVDSEARAIMDAGCVLTPAQIAAANCLALTDFKVRSGGTTALDKHTGQPLISLIGNGAAGGGQNGTEDILEYDNARIKNNDGNTPLQNHTARLAYGLNPGDSLVAGPFKLGFDYTFPGNAPDLEGAVLQAYLDNQPYGAQFVGLAGANVNGSTPAGTGNHFVKITLIQKGPGTGTGAQGSGSVLAADGSFKLRS